MHSYHNTNIAISKGKEKIISFWEFPLKYKKTDADT